MCKASPGRKKKKDERYERSKVCPELRILSLENCSSYISFSALSDNQCHITV